uniref:Uncharacterized protein n=2 Tax=Rhizophagus irregularis TaxID=588596 RepID=U9STA2_RHIID
MYNLPDQNEKGNENLENSNKTVILGTTGCGKTRLCFEALSQNYGLYLVASPYSVGSVDFPKKQKALRSGQSRPFFSVVVRCLSNLSNSFAGAFVCITGSGLSLLRAKDKISGGITKKNMLYVSSSSKKSRTHFGLSRYLPTRSTALRAIKWLKGRYRWSWTWIHFLIKSENFDPEKQLKELITKLQPVLIVYQEIFTRGRPITFTSTVEMDIMNLGFAHIKNIQQFSSIIDEPLVI